MEILECYNPAKNRWKKIASAEHEHSFITATSHQNRIYVLSFLGFEVFEPNSNTWRNLPSLNVGGATQLVSLNDKLLAVGGGDRENKEKASKTIFEFDTRNNSWNKLSDMNVARKWHRAVIVNV